MFGFGGEIEKKRDNGGAQLDSGMGQASEIAYLGCLIARLADQEWEQGTLVHRS